MTPTKAERERWTWFHEIGCVACIIEGELRGESRYGEPPDAHHEVQGYRTGHDRTAPLCPWHHRGVPKADHGVVTMQALFGPSLAVAPLRFRARYGPDAYLIDRADREIDRLRATVV